MDNITHSIIGLVTGDAIHQVTNTRSMSSVERRRLFLLASLLGNNIPDLDFLFAKSLPAPIGYLLHHRGYTHTLVASIPQGILIILLLWLLRGPLISRQIPFKDWTLALLTAVVGVGLHVFADSWNSYGVHPFYPFSNSWYYGDMIFIIEPLIWATLGAWALLELPLTWRGVIFGACGTVLYYGLNAGLISWVQVGILSGVLLLSTLLLGLASAYRRSFVALVLLLSLLGFYRHQSSQAATLVKQYFSMAGHKPPLDIYLNPNPINPFCWNIGTATIENAAFVVRRANITLWKDVFTAESCRGFLETRPSSNPQIEWAASVSTPLSEFVSYSTDCHMRQWFRYGRFPNIHRGVLRDVRYSNRASANFTDLILKPHRPCLGNAPPWTPPREDLLEALSIEL